MLLIDLNDYVLTLIFERCSIDDAITLYFVCKRFRAIVNRYTFFKKSSDLLLVGHHNPDAICYQRFLDFRFYSDFCLNLYYSVGNIHRFFPLTEH